MEQSLTKKRIQRPSSGQYLVSEYEASVDYNNAVCGWEYTKGTIMAYAHVRLAEESPSQEEEARAVKHERDRTQRKVQREPAASVDWFLSAPKTDDDIVRNGPRGSQA